MVQQEVAVGLVQEAKEQGLLLLRPRAKLKQGRGQASVAQVPSLPGGRRGMIA
jgi:hypothetical protein